MPQSSWPSSSPFALLPPPRFEGLEECGGCRPVPLDPRAVRERSHDILRPLFRRSCAAWPLSHFCSSQAIAVFGEDGDGELAQLCARDAAQTALRLMGESTTPPVGDTPATPKSPGAFHARSLALTRTGRVGQDTSGEVEVESVVDCHRAQARMVAPIVAPAPARAAEEADALPSNTIKLSPYHPNPTPGP